MTGSGEWKSWSGAIERCHSESSKDYPRYGARGIRVCESWRKSFEAFFADMGPKPSARHSLDRIDVDGDYEPKNCRWATAREQQANRRNNINIELGGRLVTLFEYCGRQHSPRYQRIAWRVARGWSMADAVFQPAGL
jgi:hypothetical protein